NPNAHFSFRRGTVSAVRPLASRDWYRVFAVDAPHPFQLVAAARLIAAGGATVQRPRVGAGPGVPTGRPARNSGTARRSAAVSSAPFLNIVPLVSATRIASGAIWRSASRSGARESAGGCAWQLAHAF